MKIDIVNFLGEKRVEFSHENQAFNLLSFYDDKKDELEGLAFMKDQLQICFDRFEKEIRENEREKLKRKGSNE